MPLEEPTENAAHSIGRLLLVQTLKSGAFEGLGIGLEDPGRASHLVLIGVRDEWSPFGLLEDKGEGVVGTGRPHPGELVGPNIHLRLKVLDILVAEATVDAVGQYHKIGFSKARLIIDVSLEQQSDAEFARALLQDQKQPAARAAAKPVAADTVHRAAEMHGDIIPVGKFLGDTAITRRVVFFEIIERSVGKHHTESKGVVGTVALVDRDLGVRPLLSKQDRRIKTGRSTTDDRDLHESLRRSGTIQLF